jgi:hypothetical protein
MDLVLERSELAILVLHMNIMRKPIKKGFKSNYGQLEGRKKVKEYDELKERFQEELNEETDPIYFNLEEQEISMLHSFLNWYVLEIQLSAEEQRASIENDEQIAILESINNKVNTIAELIQEENSNG